MPKFSLPGQSKKPSAQTNGHHTGDTAHSQAAKNSSAAASSRSASQTAAASSSAANVPVDSPPSRSSSSSTTASQSHLVANPTKQAPPKYLFQCQLAHGSPTAIISDFSNVRELYEKIADSFGLDYNDILFCTLNTFQLDMDKLLGGQLGLDDFIYAHVRDQKKELDIAKTSGSSLGLTITDNGAGKAFIKRVRPDSELARRFAGLIEVGDHIERINEQSFASATRHFDVAKYLRDIPANVTFTVRLISPMRSIYSHVGPRTNRNSGAAKFQSALSASASHASSSSCSSAAASSHPHALGNGKKTLRFKSSGELIEEDLTADSGSNNAESLATSKINSLLEASLGIADLDLALQIWRLAAAHNNVHDFTKQLDRELGDFCFQNELIWDMWGVIDDVRSGRFGGGSGGREGTSAATAAAPPPPPPPRHAAAAEANNRPGKNSPQPVYFDQRF